MIYNLVPTRICPSCNVYLSELKKYICLNDDMDFALPAVGLLDCLQSQCSPPFHIAFKKMKSNLVPTHICPSCNVYLSELKKYICLNDDLDFALPAVGLLDCLQFPVFSPSSRHFPIALIKNKE